jgi:hypothetical protein
MDMDAATIDEQGGRQRRRSEEEQGKRWPDLLGNLLICAAH